MHISPTPSVLCFFHVRYDSKSNHDNYRRRNCHQNDWSYIWRSVFEVVLEVQLNIDLNTAFQNTELFLINFKPIWEVKVRTTFVLMPKVILQLQDSTNMSIVSVIEKDCKLYIKEKWATSKAFSFSEDLIMIFKKSRYFCSSWSSHSNSNLQFRCQARTLIDKKLLFRDISGTAWCLNESWGHKEILS